MKVGLFFGSFNPIHIGHLILANHIVENSDLDQVWFVVTPHNPLKQKSTLLKDSQRLEMVYLATEMYPKIKPSDVEFKLKQPNYTIDTLVHLSEKYPNYTFSLIMGQDNIKSFHKWKNYEAILAHYPIIVYPRISNEANEFDASIHKNITLVPAPIIEISSTQIRNSIQKRLNFRPLVPEKVWQYIDHNNLYK